MTSCVCGTQWHPAPKVSTPIRKHARKLFLVNGTNRARTCDLLRVKQALFQLSYDPVRAWFPVYINKFFRSSAIWQFSRLDRYIDPTTRVTLGRWVHTKSVRGNERNSGVAWTERQHCKRG